MNRMWSHIRRVSLMTLLSMSAWVAEPCFGAEADSWPAFRGPNSAGYSATAHPPSHPNPESHTRWSQPVPWSPSSPTIWGDHLYLTTTVSNQLELRAYRVADGKPLWSHSITPERFEEFHMTEGSPAAASPACDASHVVAYFGSFGLIAFNHQGRELWRHPLPVIETAGNFGSGTSPVLYKDLVILLRDQARGSSLLALRLKDGSVAWETPRPEAPTSYGTPMLWIQDQRTDLVVFGSLTLKGYDPLTGRERWKVDGMPSFVCTTPVAGHGMLFAAGWAPGKGDQPWPSWASTVGSQDKNGDGKLSVEEFQGGPTWFKSQDLDGNGFIEQKDWETIGNLMKRGENVLVAVKAGGEGDITSSHVAWKATRGLPYVPSPLYYDGRVYLIKDGGMMSSFDATTGTPFYSQERINAIGNYYASPVAADGKIYVASLNGKLSVIKPGGSAPEVIHQYDFKERIAGTPALVGKRLYLRTQTRLIALE